MKKRISDRDIVSHYFRQNYGPAGHDGPRDGDARHEAGVTMHYFARQGISLTRTARALARAGVGDVGDLGRSYKGFLERLFRSERPGDE